MRQVAGGATDVATGNLIQFMTGVRAQLDESLQYCERELQNVRVRLQVWPTWPCAAANGASAECLELRRSEINQRAGRGKRTSEGPM